MAKKFKYVESDTQAVLKLNADLSESTVTASMRNSDTGAMIHQVVYMPTPETGEVHLDIHALAMGVYELQFEQDQLGTIFHYPNSGFDLLIIGEDLNP